MKTKYIAFLLMGTLFFESVSPVFAQASPDTQTNRANPSLASGAAEFSELFNPDGISSVIDSFSNSSAQFRKPLQIRELSKKTYRASEAVILTVENADIDRLKTSVFNADGVVVPAKVQITSDGSPMTIKISPPRNFKPGRYRVKVESPNGEASTQEFTWGVLAINTNKSIYTPNEVAKLYLAVLDETGNMVCDAKVSLTITDPLDNRQTLTTEGNNIKVNPVCEKKEYTLEPDFETRYTTGSVGQYQMSLTATTDNGTYTIQDSFTVSDSVPFDVERFTVTRVFPPVYYPVSFTVTANENFEGIIQEIVPDSFDISPHPDLYGYDEIATVSAALSEQTTLEAPIFGIGLPFKDKKVLTQGFGGIHRDPILKSKYNKYGIIGHDGADFAMEIGTEIIAVDDGTVGIARENWDYGTTIGIGHAWGKSYYGHLSQLLVGEGDKVKKGDVIGLSGNTGLSTGPHLHFGLKPYNSDADNGYFGKINPLPYLKLFKEDKLNPQAITVSSNNGAVKILKWRVKMEKGQQYKFGYQFQSPPESPQFYLLGPLEFRSEDIDIVDPLDSQNQLVGSKSGTLSSTVTQDVRGAIAFQEARKWQLAIDADGSGTNVVNPTTGTISQTGQTYTFTFTAAETMDSGTIALTVPSGWTAPQGTNGVSGYTTSVGNSNATVGTVLNTNDAIGLWEVGSADICNTFGIDTTTKIQGTGSLRCNNVGSPDPPDNNDQFRYDYTASNTQDWTGYTQVSYWINRTGGTNGTAAEFSWSTAQSITGAGQLGTCTVPSTPSSGAWVYATCTLSSVSNVVRAYGFACLNNVCNPFETGDVYIDELLIGPGVPTFSGSGPWTITTRILDAANTETFTITYGNGGGSSGVTNSATPGVHTFTTQSATRVDGTLTSISSQPIVTLSAGGPTLDQLMRHGAWFNNGTVQPFTW